MELKEFFYALDDLKRFPVGAELLKNLVLSGSFIPDDGRSRYMMSGVLGDEKPEVLADLALLCDALLERSWPKDIKRSLTIVYNSAARQMARNTQNPLARLAQET